MSPTASRARVSFAHDANGVRCCYAPGFCEHSPARSFDAGCEKIDVGAFVKSVGCQRSVKDHISGRIPFAKQSHHLIGLESGLELDFVASLGSFPAQEASGAHKCRCRSPLYVFMVSANLDPPNSFFP